MIVGRERGRERERKRARERERERETNLQLEQQSYMTLRQRRQLPVAHLSVPHSVKEKKTVSHVHHAPSTYRHPNNNIIKLMIIKMTHSIELVDCCDEFAHLMSNDTGQVDKRTLWKHAPSYHKGNTCEQESYM